ncbi:hypothetical protein [Bernardetia sp.]|uniref:hypothetical protein n=1 Tax=Bernardetia sp. TaxID=1937974 RepID=UPI0025C04BF8|nr:hypothetical protein [Bernardetia sp.]
MYTSLFLYKEIEDGYQFYVSEFSTLDALKLFPKDLEIEIIEFGATWYKNFGFATEKDIPILSTIKEMVSFLENEGDIGLVYFEMRMNKYGILSSHDDGECNLKLNSKSELLSIIRKILPLPYQNKLLAQLLKYPNQYLKIEETGNIINYPTFDDYLKARRNEE